MNNSPDFSTYTLDELIDAKNNIDREVYPDRYEAIKKHIAEKSMSIPNDNNEKDKLSKKTSMLLLFGLCLSLGLNAYLLIKIYSPSNKIARELTVMVEGDIEEAKTNRAMNSNRELRGISKDFLISISSTWKPGLLKSYLSKNALNHYDAELTESLCFNYAKLGKFIKSDGSLIKRDKNYTYMPSSFENGDAVVEIRWTKEDDLWKIDWMNIASKTFFQNRDAGNPL